MNFLTKAIELLFGLLDTEAIKDFIDAGLDAIEDKHISGEVDTPKEVAIRNAIDFLRNFLQIDDKSYGSDKEQ